MVNNWLLLFGQERSSNDIYAIDPLLPHSMGAQWLSNIASLADSSRYICLRGTFALSEAFSCMSKFAGALVVRNARNMNSRINGKSLADHSHSSRRNPIPIVIGKLSGFTLRKLCKEAQRLQSFPMLAMAASVGTSFTNFSSNMLAPPPSPSSETHGYKDQGACEIRNQVCAPCRDLFRNVSLSNTVEPRTGVEFPSMLGDDSLGQCDSSFTSEILVGTGSRTMTIIRIKSLKIYAFGFYVHPFDVCNKLGQKYSRIPDDELKNCNHFYEDLLREDINMTVRLVVNCNGIKINTVKDVFGKSLRARLTRMNPEADDSCLQAFGSLFTQDIPLHVGTTINFHRTTDGRLITEVGGTSLGAVQSRDLCRAFFDMYIGDVPVCEKTKEEIGKNVASIIRMC